MVPTTKFDDIANFFAGSEGIVAVYLFGSQAGGSSGAKVKPDVDIAVLLDEENQYDSLEAKIKIEGELEKFLGKSDDQIDVIILNKAPPLLKHEVIKCRYLIYEKSRKKRLDFELKAELEYYDTIPMRRVFWEHLVERFKQSG